MTARTKTGDMDGAGRAKDTTTLAALNPIAKEINVRLEKAGKLDGQAFDHRLAAAIKLGEARKLCDDRKINFKKWCETSVTLAYDSARKLATIGMTENPKAALQDLRERTSQQMKGSRARAVARQSLPEKTNARAKASQSSAFDMATSAAMALSERGQENLVVEVARKVGKAVVSADDAAAMVLRKQSPAEQLWQDWKALTKAARWDFVKRAASDLGAVLQYSTDSAGRPKDRLAEMLGGDIDLTLPRTLVRTRPKVKPAPEAPTA